MLDAVYSSGFQFDAIKSCVASPVGASSNPGVAVSSLDPAAFKPSMPISANKPSVSAILISPPNLCSITTLLEAFTYATIFWKAALLIALATNSASSASPLIAIGPTVLDVSAALLTTVSAKSKL